VIVDPGFYQAIEKPTELADNNYLSLGGLFLFEIRFIQSVHDRGKVSPTRVCNFFPIG